MVNAICKEVVLRKEYITENIETIYFGGGTPSLLAIEDLKLMIDCFKKNFIVNDDAEITVECNPDDINEEKLIAWKTTGINRLSIGIQSFFEEDLQWMNRAHNAKQAINCLQLATKYFNNITIDLIYGTPTLTNEQWKQNVETALSFNIPHISCYALTVEPKTALDKMIVQHKKENVDADKQAEQFELLIQWLNNAGFEHYEISNFAKPNYRSKHNSNYWKNKPYLGLGPSAHSYNKTSRQWNVANNAMYINSVEQDFVPFEIENLTPTQQLNEYIMTSLRTVEGVSLEYIQKNWGKEKAEAIGASAETFVCRGQMFVQDNHLRLTKSGKLFADGIAAALFY